MGNSQDHPQAQAFGAPRRLLGTAAMFVVAIFAAALFVVGSPARPAAAADANGPAWELFRLTNNDRTANGLGPLQMDPAVVDVAQAWASRLAATGSLVHNPNYVAQVGAAVGGQWTRVGENIGFAQTPAQLEPMFMNSAPHRANILGPYNYVGIGAAYDGVGNLWVVVDFVASPVAQPTLTPPPVMSGSQATPFVQAAYQTFFGRAPNLQELFYWVNALMTGASTPTRFLDALASSPTWVGRLVTQYYYDTLGRAPDATGFNYWVSAIQHGVPPAKVASLFYGSTEYFSRAGGTVTAWLTSLYRTLLDRAPDSGGLAAWSSQLSAGRSTSSIAYSFYQSPESLGRRVNALYEQLLGRSADPGGIQYWSHVLAVTGNDVLLAVSLASSKEYLQRAMAAYPA
jgi:uncharacterized protein YkwD